MKYLIDYMEDAHTRLFIECEAFFAFSNKQFDEHRKSDSVHQHVGFGLYCPKENVDYLNEQLELIYKRSIELDVKENGVRNIVIRELANHECYYTFSCDDVIDKLKDYPVTEDEIYRIFNETYDELCNSKCII